MIFDYLILVLVLSGIAVSLIYCLKTGISPVSSTFKSRKAIIQSIPKNQKGYIYELGAGWGALAFPLSRRCPDATVVAYELSPVPWLFMKIRAFIFRPRNLILVRRNFFDENLGKASLVVCYLLPQAMTKLSPKLAQELDSSAKVICNTFELPAWTPSLITRLEDLMCPEIFYYKMDNAFVSLTELMNILATLT